MYGKLIDGEIIYAPEEMLLEDGTIIKNFNRSISKMVKYEFKPVVDTKPGYDVHTQYCNFVGYVDTGAYVRYQWEVVDIEFSEAEIQNQEAQKAMEMLNMDFASQVQTLSDEMALEVPSVFPVWQAGVEYEVGFKLRYDDILYKVLQDHTSQADWTPNVAVSLFARVLNEPVVDPETGKIDIPEWEQPDSSNPYMIGDRVLFEGEIYDSLIDYNIWSPKDNPQGWLQLTGEVEINNSETLENPEE